MNRQGWIKVVLVATLISLMPMIGWAGSNNNQGRRSQGAPPEAIKACEDKQAGDSVEFTGRRGETLAATCQEHAGQLVAVPDNVPEGGGRR
ncbi:MAG: hypothetical protein L3J63_13190 [Geopsychrobacter sp.]|nr:hypothetical protein [Geopsychrobacter sp.]